MIRTFSIEILPAGGCHPERSEGSLSHSIEILRSAQNDKARWLDNPHTKAGRGMPCVFYRVKDEGGQIERCENSGRFIIYIDTARKCATIIIR